MRHAFALLLLVVVAGGACAGPDEDAPSAEPTPAPTMTAAPTASPTSSRTPSPTVAATPAPARGGTYLALGDSLAVGVGATRPDETGYVARLFAALEGSGHATALRNLAISGETSTSMIREGQLAAAIEAIEGAAPPIAVVTLDIGGNDLLRLLGTETCAADPQGADCLQLLALTLQDFATNYGQIVRELRSALVTHAPEARLAVMTYFNPFSGTDAAYEAAAELALLGVDGRLDCNAADPRVRGMNDIIACIGEELGATAVDIQPAFDGLGLELTHIGSEDIHANDAGYELIARAMADALVD